MDNRALHRAACQPARAHQRKRSALKHPELGDMHANATVQMLEVRRTESAI